MVTKEDVDQFLALWDKLAEEAKALLPLLAESEGRTYALKWVQYVDKIDRSGIEFYGYDGDEDVGFTMKLDYLYDDGMGRLTREIEERKRRAEAIRRQQEEKDRQRQDERDRREYARLKAKFEDAT